MLHPFTPGFLKWTFLSLNSDKSVILKKKKKFVAETKSKMKLGSWISLDSFCNIYVIHVVLCFVHFSVRVYTNKILFKPILFIVCTTRRSIV